MLVGALRSGAARASQLGINPRVGFPAPRLRHGAWMPPFMMEKSINALLSECQSHSRYNSFFRMTFLPRREQTPPIEISLPVETQKGLHTSRTGRVTYDLYHINQSLNNP
jgi:hypothetical protein